MCCPSVPEKEAGKIGLQSRTWGAYNTGAGRKTPARKAMNQTKGGTTHEETAQYDDCPDLHFYSGELRICRRNCLALRRVRINPDDRMVPDLRFPASEGRSQHLDMPGMREGDSRRIQFLSG